MFSATRHLIAAMALGACLSFLHRQHPPNPAISQIPARYIATFFPGRVTGSPAEMLSADYIRQQFQQMGYSSDIRTFNSRYVYTAKDNRKTGIT